MHKARGVGSGTELRKTGEVPRPTKSAGGKGVPPPPPAVIVKVLDSHHESGNPEAFACANDVPD